MNGKLYFDSAAVETSSNTGHLIAVSTRTVLEMEKGRVHIACESVKVKDKMPCLICENLKYNNNELYLFSLVLYCIYESENLCLAF